uniref:Titin n=1 Tax=Echeneis naucrates TaxID=173247 RepID=A0A665VGB5_ECHNA
MNAAGVGEHMDLPGPVKASEKLEAPEIELETALRKTVNVRVCSTLRLLVTIRGRPQPEVKWSKEGGILSERAQIEVTSSYTVLLIENVNRDDTGKYVLTVENNSGSKSAFINVRVLDSPGAPANLEVKEVKRDSVSLSWETPLIDGGAKILHYIVEKREEARKAFTSVCSCCVRNSCKIDNLQEGSFYYFRVLAVNEFGTGLPAETPDAVKVSEAPPPPGKITLSDVTCNSARISWEKPDHDGGSKIIYYIVEMQAKGDDTWTTCSESKALEATITRLAKGKEFFFRGEQYDFRVIAKNSAELFSAPSETTGPVTVQHDVEPPKITMEDKFRQVVTVKAGELLRIDAAISGCPNPTVIWMKNGRNIGAKGRIEIIATRTHTSLLVKESVRKDSGQYTLTLQNTGGTASKVITCKVLDRPGPPAGPLEVSGLSAEKCSLSWGPPHETGGAEIMHYIVEKCETSRVSWTLLYDNMMATTCKIVKLVKGNEYLFRVRAVNKYGEGETLESEPIRAADPFTIPSAPLDVEVTSASTDAMTVCWKRPSSDGGSRINGYVIEKREKQGVRWTRVNKKPVYDLRVKATGLHEGCEYEFRVFAENSAGLSEPSLPCLLTLAEDPKFLPSPPAKPSIVDSTRSSVTLSWNKPLFDGGAAITGYKVEFKKSEEDEWTVGVHNTDKTEFTVTGLTSGAEYIFIVRSMNKIGISEPSPETDPQNTEMYKAFTLISLLILLLLLRVID